MYVRLRVRACVCVCVCVCIGVCIKDIHLFLKWLGVVLKKYLEIFLEIEIFRNARMHVHIEYTYIYSLNDW